MKIKKIPIKKETKVFQNVLIHPPVMMIIGTITKAPEDAPSNRDHVA